MTTRLALLIGIPFLGMSAIYMGAMLLKGSGFLVPVAPALSGVAISVAVDVGYYPPAQSDFNNLDAAINGEGVFGIVYDASSQIPDDEGVYNFCNMPHVRRSTYVKPSDEYELIYVEVAHRHHKRTPYRSNSFPVESYPWDCDDVGLHMYGQPFGGHDAAMGYRSGFSSFVNPFIPSGWRGRCQFPQITAGGLEDSWIHGADLYDVYGGLVGFLPDRGDDWKSKVSYRVTNNPITSQVAGMVINGMWGVPDSIPLLVQDEAVDSLEPRYSCSVGSSLYDGVRSKTPWTNHLAAARQIYAVLDEISGVPLDDSGFHISFDHYYDNLQSRQCHGKPLPCQLIDGTNSSNCVTQEQTNTVYRLGHWEYSRQYRDDPDSLAMAVMTMGVWFSELTAHVREVIEGKNEAIYFHNVAHDGSVSRMLGLLQVETMFWPGMGAEIVFELWRKKTWSEESGRPGSGYHVRVLYGGEVMKSSNPTLGRMDMLPVETFLEYIDGLTGKDAGLVKGMCSGDNPPPI